jgi:hypothetical protein
MQEAKIFRFNQLRLNAMRKIILLLLLFFSLNSYCQENILLPSDSLLKMNRVKKLTMRSNNKKNNAKGENVYRYNQAGKLIKHEVMSTLLDKPLFITDYFFDSTGKAYASVFHRGETNTIYSAASTRSVYTWTSGPTDSIIYYYQYNAGNKIYRAYRNYPSGEPMNETIYTYDPMIITRKSFNQLQQLTAETNEDYQKGGNIEKIVSKKFDDGKEVSTFT